YEITYQTNVVGMRILNNTFYGASSPIGPSNGTQLLTGALIADNFFPSLNNPTPPVVLNNLAGQTSNVTRNNHCAGAPCTVGHTAGSNIVQWQFNVDDGLTAVGM